MKVYSEKRPNLQFLKRLQYFSQPASVASGGRMERFAATLSSFSGDEILRLSIQDVMFIPDPCFVVSGSCDCWLSGARVYPEYDLYSWSVFQWARLRRNPRDRRRRCKLNSVMWNRWQAFDGRTDGRTWAGVGDQTGVQLGKEGRRAGGRAGRQKGDTCRK